MTETDAARDRDLGGGVTEVATMLMKAALRIPLGTMKAACALQMSMLEMVEGLLPGADAEGQGDARSGSASPPSVAGASASSSSGPASSAGGWGPVTPQDPVTGWGPMPR